MSAPAVTAKANYAATFENALLLAFVAQGITSFLNAFQVRSDNDKVLPQVQFGLGVFVPEGHNSKTGTLTGAIVVLTHATDDPNRTALATLLGSVIAAIDSANSTPSTFASSYLPSGYHFGGIVITDGPPPYMDENLNAIGFGIEVQGCIP
jgi:hypothetical protein